DWSSDVCSSDLKTRLLLVMQQRAYRLDPLAQISQKNIDLVSDQLASCKVGHHVAMLLAHQVHRLHHSIEHFRQAKQTRCVTRRRSVDHDVRVLPGTIQLTQLK